MASQESITSAAAKYYLSQATVSRHYNQYTRTNAIPQGSSGGGGGGIGGTYRTHASSDPGQCYEAEGNDALPPASDGTN